MAVTGNQVFYPTLIDHDCYILTPAAVTCSTVLGSGGVGKAYAAP